MVAIQDDIRNTRSDLRNRSDIWGNSSSSQLELHLHLHQLHLQHALHPDDHL
jgi:hypothetical protein